MELIALLLHGRRKKEDGENYKTSTIHTFLSLVGRYMKDNKIGDLATDQDFQGAKDVKKAKLKVLKSDGKGNRPNRATSLSEEEERLLFQTGQMGLETPEALQRTIWWLRRFCSDTVDAMKRGSFSGETCF